MNTRLVATLAVALLTASASASTLRDRGPVLDLVSDSQDRRDGRVVTEDRDGTELVLAIDGVVFEHGNVVDDLGRVSWCEETSRGLSDCVDAELDLTFGLGGTEWECFGGNVPVLGGYCFCIGDDDCTAMFASNACAEDGEDLCEGEICGCEQ